MDEMTDDRYVTTYRVVDAYAATQWWYGFFWGAFGGFLVGFVFMAIFCYYLIQVAGGK